jgi:Arc/MetJ family transcription regulator
MPHYHKTTVEIDADALKSAEAVLGTRGVKATVNGALREVNRRAALENAARYLLDGELRVPDEREWADWRKPRS